MRPRSRAYRCSKIGALLIARGSRALGASIVMLMLDGHQQPLERSFDPLLWLRAAVRHRRRSSAASCCIAAGTCGPCGAASGAGPPRSGASCSRCRRSSCCGSPSRSTCISLRSQLLMAALQLSVAVETAARWPRRFASRATCSSSRTSSSSTLDDGAHRGRGEAAGVYYLGDDAEHMVADARSAARRDRSRHRPRARCSSCCRPAARATRSTARCGSSKRRARARAVLGARRARRAATAGHDLHARRRRARGRWPTARARTPAPRRSRSS